MLISVNVLDRLFDALSQTSGEVNEKVVTVTKNVSDNLLLDALPNDPPMFFGGLSLALSSYKITPKKFK
jgi:hypothetical protein